jgi:hypothetical protein
LLPGGLQNSAVYAFPEEHWRRIRTNNPLERILREIRRRTRVFRALELTGPLRPYGSAHVGLGLAMDTNCSD